MKNNDCLFSDIQNLCNAESDWLIKKKSIIQLNQRDNILCLLSHRVYDNSVIIPVNQTQKFRSRKIRYIPSIKLSVYHDTGRIRKCLFEHRFKKFEEF